MSESSEKKSAGASSAKQTASGLAPESQHERRIKYGLMVALTSLIAIVLAAFVVYAAQRSNLDVRKDTTSMGLYSLTPQTINLIKANKEPITIISLYTKAKTAPSDSSSAASRGPDVADQAEKVSDLLDEYQDKGKNIKVEVIDPVTNPGKVDDLINSVTAKYGGEVAKYKAFVESLIDKPDKPGRLKKMSQIVAKESDAIQQLPLDGLNTKELRNSVYLAMVAGTSELPKYLKIDDQALQRKLKQSLPDYKGIVSEIQENMDAFSQTVNAMVAIFDKYKDNAQVPEAIRKYMSDSVPVFKGLAQDADDFLKESKNLGELKLDTVREALNQKNAILVEGEHEFRVLAYDKVWRGDVRDMQAAVREGKIQPRFAGEQMVTTAILGLEHPKKLKVAFIRAGGPPVASSGFMESGPYAAIAEGLEEYNYDVVDKDLTGMYEMMSRGQAPPEPSEADIKDAIWVIVGTPPAQSPMGPPPTIAPKVMEHLASGGSALFLLRPRGADMSLALKEWGIEAGPERVCVHERIESEGARGDMINDIEHDPRVFDLKEYGDHLIGHSLASLPGVLVNAVPVKIVGAKGITSSTMIPVPGAPDAPTSWSTSNFEALNSDAPLKFDAKVGDEPGPLFAGAVAEKAGAGRVVVIGSTDMFGNGAVTFPDEELQKKGIIAPRFPGNAALFMNSIFWLSHQEPMIAISPAAMNISRLAPLSRAAQNFWRIGVLLVGLPALVLLAGFLVFLSRRD